MTKRYCKCGEELEDTEFYCFSCRVEMGAVSDEEYLEELGYIPNREDDE